MSALSWLEEELSQLKAQGLLRGAGGARGQLVDVCSNDYLGYVADSVSRETSQALGAGASRLVSGSFPVHDELEGALASWVHSPAALLFSSGYAANVSTIPALVGPSDAVFSDQLNHASIIDGCRLSRARIHVYPHLRLESLREQLRQASGFRRRLVVTESYFSMDGDGPPLADLAEICAEFGAIWMLDEAHALGVFGPQGSGLAANAGVVPDVLVGTFGKALGAHGAFVAGSAELRSWLWNRARGFVFSTALGPALAEGVLTNLKRAQQNDSGRARLAESCSAFAERLRAGAIPLATSQFGPIFPIVLGTPERALAASKRLHEAGFFAPAIRPPTVPEGTARLRITLNARMPQSSLDRLANELVAACA